MVALLCFLLFLFILIELFLSFECKAINTRKHLAFFVATPVCTSHFLELECTDFASILNMRPTAQIRKITERIERNNFVLRQIINNLSLILLTILFCPLQSLSTRLLFTNKRKLLRNNFAHLFFNLAEVIFRDLHIAKIDIVIETIINRWTNSKLNCCCVRIQILNRRGHDMAERMTHFHNI